MNVEFRAHLLLHLARIKQRQEGFTILELLVVIFILGLLSAIAMPSMLGQSNKARESEAKTYISAINRAQQAYFLERGTFGYLSNLELGLSSSVNYLYSSLPSGVGMTAMADTTATPVGSARGYAGRVWLQIMGSGNVTSLSIVCEGTSGVVPTISGTVCP
jgi:prepilin-type N-terminal cleavage/methylation domain-containing protein